MTAVDLPALSACELEGAVVALSARIAELPDSEPFRAGEFDVVPGQYASHACAVDNLNVVLELRDIDALIPGRGARFSAVIAAQIDREPSDSRFRKPTSLTISGPIGWTPNDEHNPTGRVTLDLNRCVVVRHVGSNSPVVRRAVRAAIVNMLSEVIARLAADQALAVRIADGLLPAAINKDLARARLGDLREQIVQTRRLRPQDIPPVPLPEPHPRARRGPVDRRGRRGTSDEIATYTETVDNVTATMTVRATRGVKASITLRLDDRSEVNIGDVGIWSGYPAPEFQPAAVRLNYKLGQVPDGAIAGPLQIAHEYAALLDRYRETTNNGGTRNDPCAGVSPPA